MLGAFASGGGRRVTDRYLHDITDVAARRSALLEGAADILQRLLAEIDSPPSGTFAALAEQPIGYTISFQLALRQLRCKA